MVTVSWLMRAHVSKMDCERYTSPDSSKRGQSSAQAVAGADDPVQAVLTAVKLCDLCVQHFGELLSTVLQSCASDVIRCKRQLLHTTYRNGSPGSLVYDLNEHMPRIPH